MQFEELSPSSFSTSLIPPFFPLPNVHHTFRPLLLDFSLPESIFEYFFLSIWPPFSPLILLIFLSLAVRLFEPSLLPPLERLLPQSFWRQLPLKPPFLPLGVDCYLHVRVAVRNNSSKDCSLVPLLTFIS